MDEYLEAMAEDMNKAQEALGRELAKIRTGRATPKLVDGVMVAVTAYGATMPLNQLATIQVPDARLLVISPWDKSTLSDIERAILQADLGLNPNSDGQVIRLPVPPLTKERRVELGRAVKRVGEEAKIRVRHVRREYNELFKGAAKDGDISEDESRRYVAEVQEVTNREVAKVDEAVALKEAEVQEV